MQVSSVPFRGSCVRQCMWHVQRGWRIRLFDVRLHECATMRVRITVRCWALAIAN